MNAAAFLDRDGVLNELVPDPVSGRPESPLEPEDVALLPGVAAALGQLKAAGYLLVGISNQPAAAKGTVTVAQLDVVQARVLELLALEGAALDAYYACLHHPDGIVAELSSACDCRKPAPGLLLEAAHEHELDLGRSWMIGDTDGDVGAGLAAGCRTVLIEHPGSAHKRTDGVHPNLTAPDLLTAARLIPRPDTR